MTRKLLQYRAGRVVGLTGIALVAIAATACNLDKTLNVEDPDVATPGSVTSAAGLAVVYAGARAEFENAYSGAPDNAQTLPGLLVDELHDIDTFPTRIESSTCTATCRASCAT